ncbi:MAG: LLM class flavin-dependent oxidoreductase [Dehalococcoidia bacterium]|nr:LLM class flavin-dependent oxidoreductase [Dehalococcoidia bacterium]
MKFAPFGVGGGAFEAAAETAQLVESIGYDGLFFGFHHSPDLQAAVGIKNAPPLGGGGSDRGGSQWPRIAALAARTKTLTFGTGIFLLPFAHPLNVAEDVATIDHISKGRIILGVGPGYNKADFDMFGMPVSNRVSLFEEGLEVIRRAWTEDKFNFVGKRYTIRNARVLPKPYQKPHPPIWVGPWSMEGFKRAARQGDGVITDPMQGKAALKAFIAAYRELCLARGKKPVVALMREMLLASSKEEALQLYGKSIIGTMQYYAWGGVLNKEYEPWLKDVKSYDQITFQMVNADNRLLWGSPDDIIGQIHQMNEEFGGIDYLIPAFVGTGGPDAAKHQQQTLRLFGEKVMPKFK